jgi:UDP-N-acetylmuramate: L-alanyl-gamma-D-glutamyl-meso-diaminopimelate ligase
MKTMQAGFLRAFAQADEVYLGPVNRPEKLKAEERFDPEAVAENLEAQGVEAHFATTNAALLDKLIANTITSPGATKAKPRVVAFFSNGSFDGIIGKFVTAAGTG